MTDIEIAKKIKLLPIEKIAKKIGIKRDELILYGNYKAKVDLKSPRKKVGKVILVTSLNPTKSGEGKTTVSIGLADSMNKWGYKTTLALREPSLGPVFGLKGGATGGGYSQVAPMEDINLHFNGDFHAITSANNLICASIDNHIFQGNELDIDKDKIMFNRAMDMNDRALREILVANGTVNQRKDCFNITAACEIMAIMCLATNLKDLKERLNNITVAQSNKRKLITVKDLKIADACAILLKDALKPNLVQTLYHTPAFIHLGPFANIAHGCNSIIATKMAQSVSDYVVTEAGFGADLGAQKFLDVKCRLANITPSAVVVVATVKALKLHGGSEYKELNAPCVANVIAGCENLTKHIGNIQNVYHLPVVCVLNKFVGDTKEEIDAVKSIVENIGAKFVCADIWGKTDNGKELAQTVVKCCEQSSTFTHSYEENDNIDVKIEKICKKIYGAKGVEYCEKAKEALKIIDKQGLNYYPVIIAKTQYSLSDNPKLLNAPKDFQVLIRDIQICTGSQFIVAIAGDMMLMPGLNKTPAGTKMKIDEVGNIEGIF